MGFLNCAPAAEGFSDAPETPGCVADAYGGFYRFERSQKA